MRQKCPQFCTHCRVSIRSGVNYYFRYLDARLVTALLSALLAGCVTTLPGPAVELTADCRVVASGSGGGGRGGGYGGGAPGAEAAPGDLLAQRSSSTPQTNVPSTTSDGVPPGSRRS